MPTTIISDLEVLPTSKKLRASTYGRGIWEVDVTQCTAAKPAIRAVTPTTACSGDSVIIEVQGTFASMRWSNGDTTRRLVLRSVTESGDYAVSIEDINGCRAVSDAIKVTIDRTPSKPSVQRRGDTLRSTTLGGVTSFQWRLNEVDIPGATSREYLPKVTGAYRVFVKNDAGCSNLSDPVDVTVTSVQEVDLLGTIVASPNPTTGEVTLQLGQPCVTAMNIAITNLAGERVATAFIGAGSAQATIDMSSAASGVYLIRCDTGRTVVTIPVIRQ
jgi:hypothetical protein